MPRLDYLDYVKRKTGLWVPKPLGFAQRRCCCVTAECPCSNCAEAEPPCCLDVTIAGMAENACVDDECHCLDRTYRVPRTSACTWSRTITSFFCGDLTITIVLALDGSDYKLTTTLSGDPGTHVWTENLGASKPTCTSWNNQNLTHISSTGDCDSSSATCKVTARAESVADCTQDWLTCSHCICGEQTRSLEVTIAGMVNDGCASCNEYNGTFILGPTQVSCMWGYAFPSPTCNPERLRVMWSGLPIGGPFPIEGRIYHHNCSSSCEYHLWESVATYNGNKADCLNWKDFSLPWKAQGGRAPFQMECDSSNATFSITAL